MIRLILIAILLVTGWLPDIAIAAGNNDAEPDIPAGAMYRYYNAKGQLVVSSTLPQEAVQRGYEVLDRQGNLIKEVEAAPSPEDLEAIRERKEKMRERQRQKQEDERLLRLYAGPDDAIRARDRQIEALRLNIGYSSNNIDQVEEKLSEEISAAARFERQGREVPEQIQTTINRYQRQLKELNREVEGYKKDMEEVRQEFAPIIKRLRVLTGEEEAPPSQSEDAGKSVTEDEAAQ